MSDNNTDLLKKVVDHVFNNWTALQLAVEHEMGGPTSRQTAIEALDWVTQYCLSQSNIQVEELTEALEDILDEEYDLICEDDSPKQVANVLVKFRQYLVDGDLQQFETDFNNLPKCKIWLSQPQKPVAIPEETNQNESSSTSQEMEVDSEWTVVHNKRKK